MARLRFSLLSLVLASLWLAALSGVYLRRDAWVLDPRSYWVDEVEERFPKDWRQRSTDVVLSQDGKRVARVDDRNLPVIFDLWGNTELAKLKSENERMMAPEYFFDDDTLLCSPLINLEFSFYQVWRRRYPEWWWGHFYRVEVWLAVLLPLVGIWRAARARRGNSTSYPASGASSSQG